MVQPVACFLTNIISRHPFQVFSSATADRGSERRRQGFQQTVVKQSVCRGCVHRHGTLRCRFKQRMEANDKIVRLCGRLCDCCRLLKHSCEHANRSDRTKMTRDPPQRSSYLR